MINAKYITATPQAAEIARFDFSRSNNSGADKTQGNIQATLATLPKPVEQT